MDIDLIQASLRAVKLYFVVFPVRWDEACFRCCARQPSLGVWVGCAFPPAEIEHGWRCRVENQLVHNAVCWWLQRNGLCFSGHSLASGSGLSSEYSPADIESLGGFSVENKEALADDLRLLACLPELCDVTFLVGEEKQPICGVRAILAARSRWVVSTQ